MPRQTRFEELLQRIIFGLSLYYYIFLFSLRQSRKHFSRALMDIFRRVCRVMW